MEKVNCPIQRAKKESSSIVGKTTTLITTATHSMLRLIAAGLSTLAYYIGKNIVHASTLIIVPVPMVAGIVLLVSLRMAFVDLYVICLLSAFAFSGAAQIVRELRSTALFFIYLKLLACL